ncbi:MAG: DUF2520 domain-containing protein [Paramuribaculum sp.]|nr:DUF2520 domain-containing protein [Paramuribaculum sp.]
MSSRRGVVILGAGNVASALAPALDAAGYSIRQVFSRDIQNAVTLAETLGSAEPVDSLDAVVGDAEFYIVSLTDKAIAEIAGQLKGTGGLWMHTSGGIPANELAPASGDYGVLYPLQTFSKGRPVDFADVPVFIEANTPGNLKRIRKIAEKISKIVSEADSNKRLRLHAAAVFACNFVNYLWSNADAILAEGGESLEVLYPLIKETLAKAIAISPYAAQTGPARRGDSAVTERHVTVMTPRQATLYRLLAQEIADTYLKDIPL